eukprot:4377982-Pleurochrysis_carterae.AAC.1
MSAVCMRASSAPRCRSRSWSHARDGGWVVMPNEMRKLRTQEGKEDDTEALGVVRCAEEAEA